MVDQCDRSAAGHGQAQRRATAHSLAYIPYLHMTRIQHTLRIHSAYISRAEAHAAAYNTSRAYSTRPRIQHTAAHTPDTPHAAVHAALTAHAAAHTAHGYVG